MNKKLMLVDDHSLFLEGLQYLLETYGFQIAGIAKDGSTALKEARILKPDIILMDIKMPGLSGIDTLKLIKAEMPDIKIIMLTTSDEDKDLFDSVKYGASGYLLKNTNGKELVEMLSVLEKGDVPLSPGLALRILEEFRRNSRKEHRAAQYPIDRAQPPELSERQTEVLEMVAKGNTYKEIGKELGISERTVKYHMERILELLHLENRAQVIAYASKSGIVDDPISE